jgi:hypothetical protein
VDGETETVCNCFILLPGILSYFASDLPKDFKSEAPSFTISIHLKNILLFEIAKTEINMVELLDKAVARHEIVLKLKKVCFLPSFYLSYLCFSFLGETKKG